MVSISRRTFVFVRSRSCCGRGSWHVHPGKSMQNWVTVEPEGVEGDGQLKAWIDRAWEFVKTLQKNEGNYTR